MRIGRCDLEWRAAKPRGDVRVGLIHINEVVERQGEVREAVGAIRRARGRANEGI